MSDPLKEAFFKVRQDIDFLYSELSEIKQLLYELQAQQTIQPTNQHLNTTYQMPLPTQEMPLNPSIGSKTTVSTGNDGVPTNQQTIQPTNQHPLISTPSSVNDPINNLRRVSEVLATLDDLKKEVRIKFKKLTEQEMLIYSTIYQLEDQGFVVDYAILAQKTGLTEISIRDYIRKILQKDIPLLKLKESNKKVILKIPQDLKRVASLSTINQLRAL